MVDPLSGAVIAAAVLTEGIKFLYGQAGELLKRWRERRDGEQEKDQVEPVLAPPAGLLAGPVTPTPPDYGSVEKLEPELSALWRSLGDYAHGVQKVDPEDALLHEQVDAMRRMLEVVYAQRITFTGEQRPASGPIVEGTISADEILGDAAAVRVKVVERAKHVKGNLTAKRVGPGAKASAVDIERA